MANPDYFSGLQSDMSFGKYHVPSPGQYDVRIAARQAMEVGWHSEFIGSTDNAERAGEAMETAVNDPNGQIVSLVFDRMSPADLVDAIVTLTETSNFYL